MSEASRPHDGHRRRDPAAMAIGVGLGIVAVVLALNTRGLTGGAYTRIGPAAFPYAVAAALAVLSACTVVAGYRGRFPERDHDETPPILWIVGGLVVQLLALERLGFSIATGLLFAATARGFGKGPLWKSIPIGIVLCFAIWLVFTKLLKLSLPAGPLEQLLR